LDENDHEHCGNGGQERVEWGIALRRLASHALIKCVGRARRTARLAAAANEKTDAVIMAAGTPGAPQTERFSITAVAIAAMRRLGRHEGR
jgi:hypothetical protein